MTFRDDGSTERICGGRYASLRYRPLSAIGGQPACHTRPKGSSYSVGGGGGGVGGFRGGGERGS